MIVFKQLSNRQIPKLLAPAFLLVLKVRNMNNLKFPIPNNNNNQVLHCLRYQWLVTNACLIYHHW
jgi:hypothetical protein